jgi:hypothetical protein
MPNKFPMSQITMRGVIDMRPAISAIKKKYGAEYYRSAEAQTEVTALWKCTPNECGVFHEQKKETIVSVGGCKGTISFVQTPIGWLIGVSVSTSLSGRGYAASVWDDCCFATYDDARLAGIQELTEFFESTIHDSSGGKALADAKAAIATMCLERTPQLSLF